MSSDNSQKRVLIVEDNKGWQDIFRNKLNPKGYILDFASTLDEAITQLDYCVYHTAVIDLVLDENHPNNKEGIEVIKYMWKLNDGTRAVIHSGYLDENIITMIIKELSEEGIPPKTLDFLKKGSSINTSETLDAIDEAIKEAIKENQRITSRMIWKISPFSFINGKLARDIQREIGGGRMDELRGFLGELCEPYAPWLAIKDSKILTTINQKNSLDKQRVVGYQTLFWSRSLGGALAIRFGRNDSFKETLNKYPIETLNKLGKVSKEAESVKESQHFAGEVYQVSDIDFNFFRRPAPKRTIDH